MGNNYTVKPNWKGKQTVSYECGHCNAPLESPLEDAGDTFPCPTCGGSVQTPGSDELRKHRLAKEQQRIEEAKRNEAERASKVIAEARRAAEAKSKTPDRVSTPSLLPAEHYLERIAGILSRMESELERIRKQVGWISLWFKLLTILFIITALLTLVEAITRR